MPLYEALVRRAVEAQERAGELTRDTRRLRELAQILREAAAGKVTIVRCAWCDRYRVADEWLHLNAIGSGEQQIRASLLQQATHTICPDCLEVEKQRSPGRWAGYAGRSGEAESYAGPSSSGNGGV